MTEESKQDLIQDLNQILVGLFEESNKTFLKVRETLDVERFYFIKVYLWWNVAKGIDGYLESLYKEKGIRTRRVKNGINLRPLITLLSNGRVKKNDLDLWAQVLKKVHTEFETNFEHYMEDATNRLCLFIKNNRGKTGLAGYHNKVDEDDEVAKLIKSLSYKPDDQNLNEKEFEPLLIREAKSFYSENTSLTDMPIFQTNSDSYSTVLIRQTDQGSKLIGSCDSEEIINKILISVYRNDFNALPTSLRMVLEPLHLFNIPTSVCKNIDKYIEYVKVTSRYVLPQNDDTKSKVVTEKERKKAEKRLIFRKESNDFLLSNVWVKASPVLIAKPKAVMFGKLEGDIYLSSYLRNSIEVKLLHQQLFNIFTVNNAQFFNPSPPYSFARYSLELKTKLEIENTELVTAEQVIGFTENLHHDNITWRGFFGNFNGNQVDIKKEIETLCTWHGELDLNGVRNAVNVFFKPWINGFAKTATRDRNKLFKLELNPEVMQIEFELGKNGFDQQFLISVNNGKGSATLNVRSTDFAFLLRQLSDIDITGVVKFSACSHGMILAFESEVMSYKVVIPSCKDNFSRNDYFFSEYEPVVSTLLTLPSVPDEEDSPFITREMELRERNEILAVMERLNNI